MSSRWTSSMSRIGITEICNLQKQWLIYNMHIHVILIHIIVHWNVYFHFSNPNGCENGTWQNVLRPYSAAAVWVGVNVSELLPSSPWASVSAERIYWLRTLQKHKPWPHSCGGLQASQGVFFIAFLFFCTNCPHFQSRSYQIAYSCHTDINQQTRLTKLSKLNEPHRYVQQKLARVMHAFRAFCPYIGIEHIQTHVCSRKTNAYNNTLVHLHIILNPRCKKAVFISLPTPLNNLHIIWYNLHIYVIWHCIVHYTDDVGQL